MIVSDVDNDGRFTVEFKGRTVEFVYSDDRCSVHNCATGEELYHLDAFNSVRFSGPYSARYWVQRNFKYVMNR